MAENNSVRQETALAETVPKEQQKAGQRNGREKGKEKDQESGKKWTWQEVAEKRKQQMKEITERLETGLKEYMTTDEQFKKVLDTMAKFYHYSANNVLLIAMQMPTATYVASYTSWQKKFKRQVKKGQRGLSIITPAPYKKTEEQEVINPDTGKPVMNRDGTPITEEVEVTVPRYKVAKVFDLSQTTGAPLPELDVPELTGTVENYRIFMDAMRAVSPVPIRFDAIEGEAKGYYDSVKKEIVIKEGMSELQTMKTAVHEISHARLHDRDTMLAKGGLKDQKTRELEAESIAYVVLSHYHLDTSDYSIPYLASWSSSQDTDALRASMDTIRRAASEIFDEVEIYLAERDVDRYTIYQIQEDSPAREYCFMDMEFVKKHGCTVSMEYYQDVYRGYLGPEDTLYSLYYKFNQDDRPAATEMRSVTTSDVIVLHKNGEDHAYYVDSIGYVEVPQFFLSPQEQEQSISVSQEQEKTEPASNYQETSVEEKKSNEDLNIAEQGIGSEDILTFYAAECMAFPVMGRYQGGLTFADAVKAFNEFPEGNPNGGKGIGFTLQDGSDYAGDFPLVVDGRVQTETINAVDHFHQMPAIQEVIEDAKKVFPDREEALDLAETVQSPSGSLNREAASVTHSDERKAEQTERKPYSGKGTHNAEKERRTGTMKKITFDEEELFAIAVFNVETREKAITGMEKVLDLMDDDPEMKALLVSVKEKLKRITDKDYKELDVERYIEELEEEDDEEESVEEDGNASTDSGNGTVAESSNGEEDAT